MLAEVQEVIDLVHERDALLARLAVIDQLLAQAVTGERPSRAPALPPMPLVARAPMKCRTCGQAGHNARTCGRAPKKSRTATAEPEPGPAASLSRDEHLGMVEIAADTLRRTLPASVDLDGLLSAGATGLLEAAASYDASRCPRFEGYAWHRVVGAMRDELRSSDTLSRDMRRLSNQLRDTARQLESELGRAPDHEELARRLGVDVDELHARQQKLSGSRVVGIDDAGPDLLERTADQSVADPFEVTARREVLARLQAALESLPSRQRRVMALLYLEGMVMRDVGAILSVTESRVCQIHAAAVARLREGLGDLAA
ncbi:MAG TPA: sigma-70 family RNA polymerase sigma factor [Jatrophihabitantaceae bacterium]|nr:sigma-70 family RNA polymerase sigma factor [Jatrophihabitantaceae bacterium]